MLLGAAIVWPLGVQAQSATPDGRTTPVQAPANTVQHLDSVLAQMTNEDALVRRAALEQVAVGDDGWTAAAHAKVAALRETMKRGSARLVLDDARRYYRDEVARKRTPPEDWVELLFAAPVARSPHWRSMVELLNVHRVLARVATPDAARELIWSVGHFGPLSRVDVERLLPSLEAAAVAALLEARQHDIQTLHTWANRQLDRMGRSIPAETVNFPDPGAVAEILRAYGRTRDLDALAVMLSFVGSERALVRDAARSAVASLGEAARWGLRDHYEQMSGKRAERSWNANDLAQRIYASFDEVLKARDRAEMERGMAAMKAERWDEAVAIFDAMLARRPDVEGRDGFVDAYVALASHKANTAPAEAAGLFRKAELLCQTPAQAKLIEAKRAPLEAQQYSLTKPSLAPQRARRQALGGAIALVSLVVAAWLGSWWRHLARLRSASRA